MAQETKEKKNIFLRILFLILKIFLVIGIIILVILILAAIAGFLFYNFFTIKTAVFCIGDAEKLPLQCSSDNECITGVFGLIQQQGTNTSGGEKVNEGMSLISGLLKSVFSDAVYCQEGYCNVKKVRGIEEIFKDTPIQCTSGEEQRIIKVTPKMIFPPSTITSIIKEFISTGKVALPAF